MARNQTGSITRNRAKSAINRACTPNARIRTESISIQRWIVPTADRKSARRRSSINPNRTGVASVPADVRTAPAPATDGVAPSWGIEEAACDMADNDSDSKFDWLAIMKLRLQHRRSRQNAEYPRLDQSK